MLNAPTISTISFKYVEYTKSQSCNQEKITTMIRRLCTYFTESISVCKSGGECFVAVKEEYL